MMLEDIIGSSPVRTANNTMTEAITASVFCFLWFL